jgi:hypothetical protein
MASAMGLHPRFGCVQPGANAGGPRASAWADYHKRPGEGRERIMACGVHME